jgi:two-component system, OmpR family, sensor kinase
VSLRARLVLALLVLFAVGMGVYGVASYRAFASSELARLDQQVLGTLPIAERELRGGDVAAARPGSRGHHRPGGPPRVVIAPGSYAELREADGTIVDRVQVADDRVQPDLRGIEAGSSELATVGSLDGAVPWRVASRVLPDGRQVLAAVPMTAVDAALDRLLTIQLVAGSLLLLVLGAGAWVVLRSGLRPLERIAAATSSITAGSLDRRVPTPAADTEVRQLATAVNLMLDDLETAFRERQATEAKLRRFLSDASHELRTPLTSIRGYAELFRLRREDTDLELIMRRIETESERMRVLVEDLLTLARLDEAATDVREPVDLAVLAADACSDAVAVDPARPLGLHAPAPVVVVGDPRHLRRAIGNLVANAVTHTPAGTPVTVAVAAAGGRGRVRVRDRGPGLDPDQLERVFDRFWQADPSRSGAGAGLGLAIVQAVAAEHGGTVDAANADDGGAVFTLAVPIGPAPDERSSDAS